MDERKINLIKALRKEADRFETHGHSTVEHEIVIKYLETGKTSADPDGYTLLDAAMNDYDCLCSDYGV